MQEMVEGNDPVGPLNLNRVIPLMFVIAFKILNVILKQDFPIIFDPCFTNLHSRKSNIRMNRKVWNIIQILINGTYSLVINFNYNNAVYIYLFIKYIE